MNVFIREAARAHLGRGRRVDVFTRSTDEHRPSVSRSSDAGPGSIRVRAGPPAPVPKDELPRFLPEFLGGLLQRARSEGANYDLVHTPLLALGLGRAQRMRGSWGVPLVASFHTLGKVKNYSLSRGETPEPRVRLSGEERVIEDADRLIARDTVGGRTARRALPGRPGPHPRRPAGRRSRTVLPATRAERGEGEAAPRGGPPAPVRRTPAGAQGPRRRRSGRSPRRWRASPVPPDDLVLAIVGGPSGADRRGGRTADGPRVGARRRRTRDAVPAAAAGSARRLLLGRGDRPRAVAVGVVRPGGTRGAGVRDAGRRRPRWAGSATSCRTA